MTQLYAKYVRLFFAPRDWKHYMFHLCAKMILLTCRFFCRCYTKMICRWW